MTSQGWYIATKNEWEELINFLGENAAKKMKDSIAYFGEGTNESGFSRLPSGRIGGIVFYIGHSGIWWSSSEVDLSSEWVHGIQLTPGTDKVRKIPCHKDLGYPVRCLKSL